LGDGYYAAPLLLDGHECASFTPCHLSPVVRRVSEFEALGQIAVRCLVIGCKRLWGVRWDPWKAGSKGFALWIE